MWAYLRGKALYTGVLRDGNGYPLPAYPVGKNPIRVRVWDKKLPMGT